MSGETGKAWNPDDQYVQGYRPGPQGPGREVRVGAGRSTPTRPGSFLSLGAERLGFHALGYNEGQLRADAPRGQRAVGPPGVVPGRPGGDQKSGDAIPAEYVGQLRRGRVRIDARSMVLK